MPWAKIKNVPRSILNRLIDVAFTLSHGVEQEIQVVDPDTGRLVGRVNDVLGNVKGVWRKWIDRDAYDTQLEYMTGINEGLDQIVEGLPDLRGLAFEAAEDEGLALIAAGVNPVVEAREGENFGEHHHIGVSSSKEQSRVHNLIREFTPELTALSVNSPIYAGRDTGVKSLRAYRSEHIRYPSRVSYDTLVGYEEKELTDKFFGNPRYWDVTPFSSEGKPTVEVRLFDTQTPTKNVIALAALLEAIALKAKKMNERDETPPMLSKEVIKENRNQAIMHGLDGDFMVENNVGYIGKGETFAYHYNDPSKGADTVKAHDAVESLLSYVEEEISEIGVKELLRPIYTIVEEGKTPADQQREIFINEGLEKLCSDLMRRTKWEL